MDDATLQGVIESVKGMTIEEITAMLAETGRILDPATLARWLFARSQGLL
jgi:hypothetical protein